MLPTGTRSWEKEGLYQQVGPGSSHWGQRLSFRFAGITPQRSRLRSARKNGIDSVFYICNATNPQEDAIGIHLIETVKRLGNITFIYHSVLHSLCPRCHITIKRGLLKRRWWIQESPMSFCSLPY